MVRRAVFVVCAGVALIYFCLAVYAVVDGLKTGSWPASHLAHILTAVIWVGLAANVYQALLPACQGRTAPPAPRSSAPSAPRPGQYAPSGPLRGR